MTRSPGTTRKENDMYNEFTNEQWEMAEARLDNPADQTLLRSHVLQQGPVGTAMRLNDPHMRAQMGLGTA
jgi:hypothetical protein